METIDSRFITRNEDGSVNLTKAFALWNANNASDAKETESNTEDAHD